MAKLKHLISKNKKKLDNIAKILFCLIEIFCFIKFHYRVIFNNICDGTKSRLQLVSPLAVFSHHWATWIDQDLFVKWYHRNHRDSIRDLLFKIASFCQIFSLWQWSVLKYLLPTACSSNLINIFQSGILSLLLGCVSNFYRYIDRVTSKLLELYSLSQA